MRKSPPALELSERFSREFSLTCDGTGRLSWADPRAQRLFGLAPGDGLLSRVVQGAEAKAEELLALAGSGEVEAWEVPLVMDGAVHTVCFFARPWEGEIYLLGSLIPEHFSRALTQLNESMQEVVNLNRQVVQQKKELERRHAELTQLNAELKESHSGVLTLHAELEDRAHELREASEIKGRVVANVSHEFRTPLHSILGLAQLLTDGTDGALTSEQHKQVQFIRTSAEELIQLVNDLLDLSRVEAGKSTLRLESFPLGGFFDALKGMLRPLLAKDSPVELLIETPDEGLRLETDRAKLSQILRNLVSNALKFTERGSVRVHSAREENQVIFTVEDTGIGIAPENLDRIFEEFSQVESELQQRVKGTGLGLPLSRQLAQLLGGDISVESAQGRGTVFTLRLPLQHLEAQEMVALVERSRARAAGPSSILVVEDDRKTLFIYEKYLTMAGFHVLPARTIDDARVLLNASRPAAIVLDVMLEGESSWNFLSELKKDPLTSDIPVLVVTVTNREQKARALGADEFWLKPIDQDRLLRRLHALTRPGRSLSVLTIDDDERSRYLVRKHLAGTGFQLYEAADGPTGVALAREKIPHVILLDFLLDDVTAFDVLDELKSDTRTRPIPVIVVTSHALEANQMDRLLRDADSVISKQQLSRELAINRIRDALRKAGVAPGVS